MPRGGIGDVAHETMAAAERLCPSANREDPRIQVDGRSRETDETYRRPSGAAADARRAAGRKPATATVAVSVGAGATKRGAKAARHRPARRRDAQGLDDTHRTLGR